jgi:hypothetical protein
LASPGGQFLLRAHLVKPHIAAYPVAAGSFGPNRVMPQPQHLPHLVEQLRLGIGHYRLNSRPRMRRRFQRPLSAISHEFLKIPFRPSVFRAVGIFAFRPHFLFC